MVVSAIASASRFPRAFLTACLPFRVIGPADYLQKWQQVSWLWFFSGSLVPNALLYIYEGSKFGNKKHIGWKMVMDPLWQRFILWQKHKWFVRWRQLETDGELHTSAKENSRKTDVEHILMHRHTQRTRLLLRPLQGIRRACGFLLDRRVDPLWQMFQHSTHNFWMRSKGALYLL